MWGAAGQCLPPAPASLVLQRRDSIAQGCLGVQRSLGTLGLWGGSERHQESQVSGGSRARGKGACSQGVGTWAPCWCLSHPQKQMGGPYQQQGTGCVACMCPRSWRLHGARWDRAGLNCGLCNAGHGGRAGLCTRYQCWAAAQLCITGSSGDSPGAPALRGGGLSFVPGGPVCSLHGLCSEAARNPSA